MNIFKSICGIFGAKGNQFYRNFQNAAKATAPITQPIIENLLASKGLPNTADSALAVLTEAAASPKPLPAPVVEGLAAVLSQSMVLVPPTK